MSTEDDPREPSPLVEGWSGGLTWLAHPAELQQRASHALTVDGQVWVIDPLEAPDVDDALDELGEVAGVVLLLDRHRRDAAAFAERYDVAVHVPEPLGDAADRLGVPVEPFAGELAATGYRARPVVDNRFWREAALVSGDGATALVPEALGTNPFYTAPGERVGVSPVLRPFPPRRQLGDLAPERLLVGHGPPVLENAGPAVEAALAGARRRAPRLFWKLATSLVRGWDSPDSTA
jgi:hypothetical protein